MLEVHSDNFQEEVIKSDKPVIVDFFAPWCPPCRQMMPVVEKIEKENPDIKVVKLNTDYARDIAIKYEIFTIPTFIVFKAGKIVETFTGIQSAGTLVGATK